jgi:hypothetical protein
LTNVIQKHYNTNVNKTTTGEFNMYENLTEKEVDALYKTGLETKKKWKPNKNNK